MKTFDEQTTLRLFQTVCVLKPQQKRSKELRCSYLTHLSGPA